MKDFGLAPSEWKRVRPLDKKLLHYHRVMEEYYIKVMTEKERDKVERAGNTQGFLASLPRQKFPIGRGR